MEGAGCRCGALVARQAATPGRCAVVVLLDAGCHGVLELVAERARREAERSSGAGAAIGATKRAWREGKRVLSFSIVGLRTLGCAGGRPSVGAYACPDG